MSSLSGDWSHGRQLLLQRSKNRALSCMHDGEYSRAFAHFIVVLTVQPEVKGELLNVFLFTLEKLSEKLEKEKQVNEVLMCYEQALEVLPNDSHVLHSLATTLFRLGFVECALSYFIKSYRANPFFTPSLYCMENLKNALVERWHFVMLNDKERNQSYKRAIQRAVQSGYNHVLDIGAGTGILSMMAVDANAEKVYACEASEIMFAVLESVIKKNEKPVETFHKLSTELCVPEDLPDRVSLIVTEIFDAGLFGENSLETLNHAWDHLLKHSNENQSSQHNENTPACTLEKESQITPLAKVIPHSAEVFVVPVECEQFRKCFRLDDEVLQAMDIKDVIPQYIDEEPYSTEKILSLPCDCKFLATPVSILQANFNSPQDIKALLQGKLLTPTFNCTENGKMDAFVMWFDLHLDELETVSSAPVSRFDKCCWEQAVFYVLPQYLQGSSPFCNTGDKITAEFLCRGHLQLQKVQLSNNSIASNPVQQMTMDPSLINLLNSYVPENIIGLNLKDLSPVDNITILDVSTFPLFTLKALKDNQGVAYVLKTQYQTEVEQLRDMYGIEHDRLLFKTYEDFFNSKLECDLLIVDPVEQCGLLKKNLMEDVTMLRLQCLKNTGIVVPGEIEVHAALVESEQLVEYSRVISDERVDGYQISQLMNAYKSLIHQDIHMSTLPHTSIAPPFKLYQINMNEKSMTSNTKSLFESMQQTTEVEVFNGGTVGAIIYWFKVNYLSGYNLDTSKAKGLWKQAACILEKGVRVSKGDRLGIQYSLKNGCIQIGISNT